MPTDLRFFFFCFGGLMSYIYIYIAMFAKFRGDQRLIAMSSINYLNLSFYSLKLCIKYEFMD